MILGSPEIYLDVGSTINLTCIIKHTPMPPADVQWKHNKKVKSGDEYSLNLSIDYLYLEIKVEMFSCHISVFTDNRLHIGSRRGLSAYK